MIGTFRGFIVPGEGANFAIFDPVIRYVFEIYDDHVNVPVGEFNPKKIKPAKTIAVTFNQREGGADPAATSGKEILEIPLQQTASFQFEGFDGIRRGDQFDVPCLNPSLSGTPPARTISDLAATGIKAFVGETDDPFFFDIPGFARFIASVRTTGAPDVSRLARGRDSFAGYNVLAIALSLPLDLIEGSNGSIVGANFVAQRHKVEKPTRDGEVKGTGKFRTVDREGNPAVNVALVPFSRKNEYNAATPSDDAGGEFAGDIVGTLQALGTTGDPADPTTNIGLLADVAVLHGDLLQLDTNIANTGTGGGDNAGAGFPNGRRLKDDVVDTLLFVVTNGAVAPQTATTAGGDNVLGNDLPLVNTFPFLGLTQQPRETTPPGSPPDLTDDNTQS
jgi:hypothetical protein